MSSPEKATDGERKVWEAAAAAVRQRGGGADVGESSGGYDGYFVLKISIKKKVNIFSGVRSEEGLSSRK